jgi:16S rRNA (cytidine1402-2'-O)-methyltransferase
MPATVYLIPIALSDDGYHAIPAFTAEVINTCTVFFAENTRTARRAFRKIDRQFDIDARLWHETGKAEEDCVAAFKACINSGETIGIVSESGCPGIADPGQKLVKLAQQAQIKVVPLSGPSSVFLALMASGMNGQQFSFHGYLPIGVAEREKKLKELDKKTRTENQTQLFIETPYRNNNLLDSILKCCQESTLLCIASNITAPNEWIVTKPVADWKKNLPVLEKVPAIFLLGTDPTLHSINPY